MVGVDGECGAVWFGEDLNHGVRAVSGGGRKGNIYGFFVVSDFLIEL